MLYFKLLSAFLKIWYTVDTVAIIKTAVINYQRWVVMRYIYSVKCTFIASYFLPLLDYICEEE